MKGHLVTVAPYGYRLERGHAVSEPREQEMIAIVRDGRARGVSIAKLVDELNERGFTTRTGKPFYKSAVFLMAAAMPPRGDR